MPEAAEKGVGRRRPRVWKSVISEINDVTMAEDAPTHGQPILIILSE